MVVTLALNQGTTMVGGGATTRLAKGIEATTIVGGEDETT